MSGKPRKSITASRMRRSNSIGSAFLWHTVPANMQGTLLFPLRTLAQSHPDIAAGYRRKYEGRENIAKLHVPLLDCSWDEVIFLSPIHPQEIADALVAHGHPFLPKQAYQLHIHALKDHEAVWFDPTKAAPNGDLTEASVWPLDRENYRSQPLSKKAHAYYAQSASSGRRPLIYGTELHVLVRGIARDRQSKPLDIRSAEIITITSTTSEHS